ncbi:hypothetical protein HPT25_17450 [Bacillus sp. BRMEA1]|uniref:hypothetical protein n=1 Tax=Neobacillus endophyticus TaxID=2738405 RepID=UPI001566B7DC|nr:hypothetical protein [Neobacillus endophyticus]NRD79146.1 hypothetical protein [Neobacillus endophyticus]
MGFIVTFGTFILSTGFLYLVGHTFHIHWLMLHNEFTNNENGFNTSIGSLTPFILGLIISYFAERIYLHKSR